MINRSILLDEAKRNPFMIQALGRAQWLGLKGAPRNTQITFEASENEGSAIQNTKWGLQVSAEQIGNFSKIGTYGNFAYSIKRFNKSNKILLGITAGITNISFANAAEIYASHPDDPELAQISGQNTTYLDLSFGVFL